MFSRERFEDLQRILVDWCEQQVPGSTLDEVEELAEQVARRAGATVVQTMLPKMAAQASSRGSSRACECGGRARMVDRRERMVGTLRGEVRVSRAYYHCSRCGRGQLPWDDEQGLDRRLWTPRVKAVVTQLAARMSFQEVVDTLAELLGFETEDSTADEVVREVGGRLRARQTAQMHEYEQGDLALAVPAAPRRLYIGMDGTHAHIDGAWHEVKVGVVYEGSAAGEGPDEPRACGYVGYVAAQEASAEFGSRLYLLAAQAGAERASERVVIGDGAQWIWSVAEHHYPGAVQIVDYWHACEHIHEFARSYYGEGSRQGRRWAREHCRVLRERGPGRLLRALSSMRPSTPEQAEVVRRERAYFGRNRRRMQYGRFRAGGLMIGSGPVESACKVVVGQRLKRAGMRWSGPGADAVLAVRAAVLSGRPELIARAARAA